jgi:hypothetical protein
MASPTVPYFEDGVLLPLNDAVSVAFESIKPT